MGGGIPDVWHFTLKEIVSRYAKRKIKTRCYRPELHAAYLMDEPHFTWIKENLKKVKISTDDLPSVVYAYNFRRKYKIEPDIKKTAEIVELIFRRN